MSAPRRPGPARSALSLLVAVGIAGCGGGSTSVDMALKRENLDLAYKNETLAKKPPTVQQVVEETPAIATFAPAFVLDAAGPDAPSRPVAPQPLPNLPAPAVCRAARPNAPASSQASTSANTLPVAGRYPARQTGTFVLDIGANRFQGPVPLQTEVTIQNVADRSAVAANGGRTVEITFDEVVPGFAAPTVTSYRITNTELLLTRITSGESVFSPTPAITIFQFRDVVGSSWNSAGIDVNTSEAMSVRGRIEARERVDLCGTVVEAYRISSEERRVNGRTQFRYETDPAQPKVYDIATQHGALSIRIIEKSTTSLVAQGTPVTLVVDFTRTLDTIRPGGG